MRKEHYYKSIHNKIINIWATTKCNQQCNYCFARGTVNQQNTENTFLSISDLKTFISWLHDSPFPNEVQIMGGEPSQHPRIIKILETLHENNVAPNTFLTNGLGPTNLFEHIGKYVNSFLFSINHPSTYTDEDFSLLKDNLSVFASTVDEEKATLKNLQEGGRMDFDIVFYEPDQDYDYIIELAKEFNVNKLTFTPAFPAPNFANDHVNFKTLKKMKPLIMNFVRDAVKADLSPGIECFLMPCIFTTEEWLYLKKFIRENTTTCGIPLEFLPDLTIGYGACNLGHLEKIDIKSQRNPENVIDGWTDWTKRVREYTLPRCHDCEFAENNLCQGGCLRTKAEKLKDTNREPENLSDVPKQP